MGGRVRKVNTNKTENQIMAIVRKKDKAGTTASTRTEHTQLCEVAEKWLRNMGCGVTFNDAFQAATPNGEQPDAIGWRGEISILIEVKTSRADFLKDRAKPFRKDPQKGMGDWRFYLCPKGMITENELPDGWGLLYWDGRVVRKVSGIPSNAQWYTHAPFSGNKRAEIQTMYSALRRLHLRGLMSAVYEPAPPANDNEPLEPLSRKEWLELQKKRGADK